MILHHTNEHSYLNITCDKKRWITFSTLSNSTTILFCAKMFPLFGNLYLSNKSFLFVFVRRSFTTKLELNDTLQTF